MEGLTFISISERTWAHSEMSFVQLEFPMKMLIDLFSTDYGLMSLAVIAFILMMGAFFLRMFLHKMNHNE